MANAYLTLLREQPLDYITARHRVNKYLTLQNLHTTEVASGVNHNNLYSGFKDLQYISISSNGNKHS